MSAHEAKKPPAQRKMPIVRMKPMIPFCTGQRFQELKNRPRPHTAPAARQTESDSGGATVAKDFQSQVGPRLFGFSDIQKTFPMKDPKKAWEYGGSNGDYLDSMTIHQRRKHNPVEVYR